VTIDHSRSDGLGRLVGTLAAILLFLSLNMFGSLVLTGVVEEKTTSVVEILLAHVRADVLLAGKVLGIGLIAAGPVRPARRRPVSSSLRISGTTVPGDVWVALPATIGWFVRRVSPSTPPCSPLAGSFVSRQEDAQSSAAPVSLIFTAGYLVVFIVAADPASTVATVLSILRRSPRC
jgi:ABC-2 type transport system permease protein